MEVKEKIRTTMAVKNDEEDDLTVEQKLLSLSYRSFWKKSNVV